MKVPSFKIVFIALALNAFLPKEVALSRKASSTSEAISILSRCLQSQCLVIVPPLKKPGLSLEVTILHFNLILVLHLHLSKITDEILLSLCKIDGCSFLSCRSAAQRCT